MKFAKRLLCMVLLAVLPVVVSAACELPEMRTDDRPGLGGGPTEVSASFVVIDFLGVDDLNQQVSLDLRLTMTWVDPRLAGLDGCRYGLGDVWFPPVILANSSNLREGLRRARNVVTVGENGTVQYHQRYSGDVSTYHNLRAFPFDHQVFALEFLAPDLGPEELILVADDAATTIADRLNVEGWTVHGVSLEAANRYLPTIGREASLLTLSIPAQRNPTYYEFRVLLPLLFVVAMSWTIFWVPPEQFEFQIGLGATAMLTTIAFSLSIASKLPDLGYLTTLDKMLIWAVFLVFLSMVEALAAGLLVLRSKQMHAHGLDRVSRVAFPVLLLGGWAMAVM